MIEDLEEEPKRSNFVIPEEEPPPAQAIKGMNKSYSKSMPYVCTRFTRHPLPLIGLSIGFIALKYGLSFDLCSKNSSLFSSVHFHLWGYAYSLGQFLDFWLQAT